MSLRSGAADWTALESTNYEVYIRNLRSIACPEETITEIVRADLKRAFAPRFASITAHETFARKDQRISSYRERQRINNEIEDLMYQRLGLQRPVRSPCPLFTAEEERLITRAAARFPRPLEAGSASELRQIAVSNQLARISFVSNYLTDEKLLFYKLDREQGCIFVQSLIDPLRPTRAEFLGIARALYAKGYGLLGSKADGSEEVVRTQLGSQRYALLLLLRQPEYRAIRNFGRMYSLTEDQVDKLCELRSKLFEQDPAAYKRAVEQVLGREARISACLRDNAIHKGAFSFLNQP
ncbi:MAG TPA: hypothetical protein VHH88_12285 [Verrucomicrobiae bacterium]|nr:hypothetical protein [Verrucomicrobiae bacterium]